MFCRLTDPLLFAVLGHEPRQRLRLVRSLIAAGMYVLGLLVQAYLVELGMADGRAALVLSCCVCLAVTGFYAVLRSGCNLRFADPALTMPQMGVAILCLAAGYVINPPVRGILLMLVALVLMFGAFTLSPLRCRQLGGYAVLVMGATMAMAVHLAPTVFVLPVELIHFVFSAVALPTVGLLAGQLSGSRITLKTQRADLHAALEHIRRLATRDELTGLPNRRHAQDLLDREARRTRRQKKAMCLGMIDLDHFKRINDTLGHAAGDEVLRRLAALAARHLRESDVLARWGGEEFLLVLPDTTPAEAYEVLERLRETLCDPASWSDRPELQVSFSAGLARHWPGETLDATIARADEVLYLAKERGRNRVLVAPEPLRVLRGLQA